MEKTYRFTLPQNKEVENTNVRVENGKVLVDVEFKERFEPKDGDFLADYHNDVFIYNGCKDDKVGTFGCYIAERRYRGIVTHDCCFRNHWQQIRLCRFATPEEKAAFLERLEKECHKRWNAEKKCLEDIRWQPKEGELFWFVGTYLDVYSTHYVSSFSVDFLRVKTLNCFRTKQAAQKVADQIKEIFKNSKAE